jgi:hypothetical protein
MHQKPWLKILTVIICLFLAVNLFACGKKIPEITGTPRPGWTAIKGEGVALFLPQGFVGGNPGRDLDKIKAQLKAIDPNSEQKLLGISQNPTAISLLAFKYDLDTSTIEPQDKKNQSISGNSPRANNIATISVNITNQSLPKEVSLNSMMESNSQKIAKIYQFSEQKMISIKQQDSARIIATIPNSQPAIKQVFYLIPKAEQKKLWVVTYTVLDKDFDSLLPMFTESIETLQFLS